MPPTPRPILPPSEADRLLAVPNLRLGNVHSRVGKSVRIQQQVIESPLFGEPAYIGEGLDSSRGWSRSPGRTPGDPG
jgi:hypothetical protein